uniref:Kelch-like protein diablo n=1 Tax=Strigamia maritima TaxID=126957 RepID=T1IJD8_STRMM
MDLEESNNSLENGHTPVQSPPPSPRLNHVYHQTAGHHANAFSAIQKMRQNGQLCDIRLIVGQVTLSAHKVILAASSAYFYAMFNHEMVEKHQTEVVLHDMDFLAVQQLVDFAYLGEITITEENVQVLLPAASLLQMTAVRDACCTFLLRQLDPTNCLGIRSFADTHACKELHHHSHRYALNNFQEVVQTEEFLILSAHEVEELISSDQLNVSSEENVYSAIIAWIKHDLPNRIQYTAQMVQHARLPLISRDFLLNYVDSEPLVRGNAECKDFLLEALRYHVVPEHRGNAVSLRTTERKPDGMRPYLFAVGGGSLFAIHSECECYNPVTDRWSAVAPMLYRRSRAGVAALGRLLYVVGGYDGASDLTSGECYNPVTNRWALITNMGTRRSCLGMCSLHGLLYAAGGYDGASCLNSVERYDPLVLTWAASPAMITRRRYCRLAIIGKLKGCIYAVGGFDGNHYQASMERLDPRMSKWMPVTAMLSQRSSCGVAPLDSMLYAVGGNDGNTCTNTAERYNPRRNGWENVSSMQSRRSTHEVVEMNGFLYAIGGNDGSSSLNSVERYDPRSNKWILVTSMLSRRSSVGATALYCTNQEKVFATDKCSQNGTASRRNQIHKFLSSF